MTQVLAIDDADEMLLAIEQSLGYQYLVTKARTIQEAVITSYSTHYATLYETG